MTDEDAFLSAIRANPKDDTTRLVFADWLDERGDAAATLKAKYLRTDVELWSLADDDPGRDGLVGLLRHFAESLPVSWKSSVAKVRVENCGIEWEFQCPKKWESLTPTDDLKVRHCGACNNPVQFCETVSEAQDHAWNGRCVVIDLQVLRSDGDLEPHVLMGAPPPGLYTDEERDIARSDEIRELRRQLEEARRKLDQPPQRRRRKRKS